MQALKGQKDTLLMAWIDAYAIIFDCADMLVSDFCVSNAYCRRCGVIKSDRIIQQVPE